jgi:hypothetical protein
VLKEFQIHPWSKEIEWEIENTLKEMKSEMRLRYPILGEVKPLQNRGIPRRNQEIATKGSTQLTQHKGEIRQERDHDGCWMPIWVPNRRTISYALFLPLHLLSLEKVQCLKFAGAAICAGLNH